MSSNKNTPGANGGAVRNVMPRFYRASEPRAIADWLNPRRKAYCQRVVHFIAWHGWKVYLPDGYADMCDGTGLDRYAVDAALDDAYALGLIDLRGSGDRWCIQVLSTDIDALAIGPWGGGR